MKKVSGKFILEQIGGVIIVSVLMSTIVAFVAFRDGAMPLPKQILNLIPVFIFGIGFFYLMFSNTYTGRIAKKTMNSNCEKENFRNYSSFTNNGTFTIGTLIRIEEHTGRIAYVSYQNPREFQMIPAKDITNIKSGYVKAPLGGTGYVYFEFYYKNKRLRIPTFTSNNVYHLQSTEVLEGISKADVFAEILEKAQQAG